MMTSMELSTWNESKIRIQRACTDKAKNWRATYDAICKCSLLKNVVLSIEATISQHFGYQESFLNEWKMHSEKLSAVTESWALLKTLIFLTIYMFSRLFVWNFFAALIYVLK